MKPQMSANRLRVTPLVMVLALLPLDGVRGQGLFAPSIISNLPANTGGRNGVVAPITPAPLPAPAMPAASGPGMTQASVPFSDGEPRPPRPPTTGGTCDSPCEVRIGASCYNTCTGVSK